MPRLLHISPFGAANSPGNDPNRPMNLAAFQQQQLQSGDRILFQGGQEFVGPINIGPVSNVFIGTYGGGKAVIKTNGASEASLFVVQNSRGVEITNLKLVGHGGQNYGLHLLADPKALVKVGEISVSKVEVTGFNFGLVVEGKGGAGLDTVTITESEAYGNLDTGIHACAEKMAHHNRNLTIRHCRAYDNKGNPQKTHEQSGNGIALSGTVGVTIEHCQAYNNGGASPSYNSGGPVGIWTYECENTVVQYCESHHNKTTAKYDGGGFDFDGGQTNSAMRFNSSHDNDGPGYLACDFWPSGPYGNVTFENNESVNDQRKNKGGALFACFRVAAPVGPVIFRNNKVWLSPSRAGRGGPAYGMYVKGTGKFVTFENNDVVVTDGKHYGEIYDEKDVQVVKPILTNNVLRRQ